MKLITHLRVGDHQHVLLDMFDMIEGSRLIRSSVLQTSAWTYTQRSSNPPDSAIFFHILEVQIADVLLIEKFPDVACIAIPCYYLDAKSMTESTVPRQNDPGGPLICLIEYRVTHRYSWTAATTAMSAKGARDVTLIMSQKREFADLP